MSALPQQHSAIISRSQSKRPRGSLDFPIRNLRRYLTMISQQIATGASLIVRHPFIRPPVPTWPLHLHLFVAVVQGTEEIQEHIVDDISDIRFLIDTFFHYLPKLPQMKIVPFQLPIPEGGRGFPGVLKDIEAGEDGKRTLPGQWISDSRVWSRIMSLPMSESAKGSKDPFAAREGENVILYTHGGGYFICSTATHREMLWRISRATGRRIFAVDYRLAPEDPYPAALQDASHAFSHLTDSALGCGFDPKNVTMAGDSAGGGLTIALMMYQRDQGLAMPSKALLLSPWLDLTMSCESWETNSKDYLPRPPRMEHKFNPIRFYCSGNRQLARDPYISPLWGNLEGLPPMLIQCGEQERLLDECILFTYKAGGTTYTDTSSTGATMTSRSLNCEARTITSTTATHSPSLAQSRSEPGFGSDTRNSQPSGLHQVKSHSQLQPWNPPTSTATATATSFRRPRVELDIYSGMVHVFQAIPLMPESRLALQRMRDFLERKEFEEEEEEKITRKQMEEEKMNQQELFEQQQQRQQEKIETMDAQSPILLMNMIREDDDHFFDMETMESGPNSTVFVLA